MDYTEIRVLLLHAVALSVKQAQAILDFWKKTPRAYSDFLRNRGCFTFISAYVGINKDSDHVFEPTKRRVLTPGIAEKFFRLEDDHISIDLIVGRVGLVVVRDVLGKLTEVNNLFHGQCAFYDCPIVLGNPCQ